MSICERYAVCLHSPAVGVGGGMRFLAYVVHNQWSRAVRRRHASPDRSRAKLSKNLPTILCGGHPHGILSRYPVWGQVEQAPCSSLAEIRQGAQRAALSRGYTENPVAFSWLASLRTPPGGVVY